MLNRTASEALLVAMVVISPNGVANAPTTPPKTISCRMSLFVIASPVNRFLMGLIMSEEPAPIIAAPATIVKRPPVSIVSPIPAKNGKILSEIEEGYDFL